jgi:hypothetical protein
MSSARRTVVSGWASSLLTSSHDCKKMPGFLVVGVLKRFPPLELLWRFSKDSARAGWASFRLSTSLTGFEALAKLRAAASVTQMRPVSWLATDCTPQSIGTYPEVSGYGGTAAVTAVPTTR